MSRIFWDERRYGTAAEKLQFVISQLTSPSSFTLTRSRITRIDLQCYEGEGEGLAGVLAQCIALAYLDLGYNQIGAVGEERLRASWRGEASGLFLELNEEEEEEEEV